MNRKVAQSSPQIASIGVRLRRLRKQRNMTQSDLARQIGIQQSDLSRIEKGEYRISLDNLFKLLSVFGVQLSEFFAGATAGQQAQPLGQSDMRMLHMLRQLSPESRLEVEEYAEFKLRRERVEQRSLTGKQRQGGLG